MPESTIEPKIIQIDKIKNGVAEILAHWDIMQIEREDEMSEKTQTMYQYEECRMKWALPKAYDSREEVEAYLTSIEDEIVDWAKGSKVTL